MTGSEAAGLLSDARRRPHFLRVAHARAAPSPSELGAEFALELGGSQRFSMRDRIVAHTWMGHANAAGYARLVFESAEGLGHAEAGEYLLIYRRDTQWAHWGVGCRRDSYEVWQAKRGTTLGLFARLQDALDEILKQPV